MSLDDHVRRAVDRVLVEVRTPLDGTLSGLANTIATESHAANERLAGALRPLDDAPALMDVLNTLADTVGREVERSAVRVVSPECVTGWRFSGLDGAADDCRGAPVGPC